MTIEKNSGGDCSAVGIAGASLKGISRSVAADLGDQYERLYQFEMAAVTEPKDGAAHFAVVPRGKELVSLKRFFDEFRAKPERRAGTATLRDVASFIAHAKRFASGNSVVFANPDPKAPSFTSVLDYHPESDDPTDADWLKHRASYPCPLSDEWKIWSAKNGVQMGQGDFAAFLEDRIQDVVPAPQDDGSLAEFARLIGGRFASPSQLIELSRGLQVNVASQVKEATTLSTGEIDIKYSEQHLDERGRPIKVANLFVITIPVFYADDPYRIPVRLRYRLAGSSIQWSFHLYRADRVFDDAFKQLVAQVETETDLPVFLGAPEVATDPR